MGDNEELERKLSEHLTQYSMQVRPDAQALEIIRDKINRKERRRAIVARVVIITLTVLIIVAVAWWVPR